MALFNYECDEIKRIIDEVSPNYPQLTTYEKEWLYFHKYGYIAGIPVELEYETVSVNPSGSVSNAIPFQYKSAILKGQTLINHVHKFEKIIPTGTGSYRLIQNITLSKPLKPNTNYLFINHSNVGYALNVSVNSETSGEKKVISDLRVSTLNFTTPDNTEDFNKVRVYLMTDNEIDLTYNTFMIIEYQDGMENWDIPYFTGMQSVKMPVLMTTGKNIVGDLEKGSIGSNGENVNNSNDYMNTRTGFILLKKDTTYSFSSNGTKRRYQLYLYDLNKNFKEKVGMANEYTPEVNCYIRLFQMDSIDKALYQVEEGTIATPYEPYKSNILTVNEEVHLRKIGEVQDTLDLITGEVTKRIGEVMLDGSQDGVYDYATNESTGILTLRLPKIPDIINTGGNILGLLSDKYASVSGRNPNNILSYNGRIMITKPISELESFNTEDKIKSFLSQNPITVQYPLATPIIKTVDLTPLNKPYEGSNHYELTSNIPCEAILEVPVVSTGKQTLEEINN